MILSLSMKIEEFFSGFPICWPKNSSNVPMSSLFEGENYVSHMCVGIMGCKKGVGPRSWASTVQDEAVDLQHGTGADGDSHSFTKGHYLK
jgi:hypothetical protein